MQMDQVTQQNAAMAEEMAATASSLETQAKDLVLTVAALKLADTHTDHDLGIDTDVRDAVARRPGSKTTIRSRSASPASVLGRPLRVLT